MGDHGAPAEGQECLCCMDDIDKDTYCEYQLSSDPRKWLPAMYCMNCTQVRVHLFSCMLDICLFTVTPHR